MSDHTTTWEDERMAGYKCNGRHTDSTLNAEDEPRQCPLCGATLRLVWNVRIEEVKAADPATPVPPSTP